MPTGTISMTMNVAGVVASGLASRTESGQISHEVPLPAGKSGTLSTRTDDDTGIATLGSGHEITTDDTVDVYWSGGVRYGMSVTAYDATTVTVDLGAGDALPAQDIEIIVTPRVEINTDFDGDDAVMVAAHCAQRCHMEFTEDDGTNVAAKEMAAHEGWAWASEQGETNPLTGNEIGKIQATNGSATAATLKIGILYDSA